MGLDQATAMATLRVSLGRFTTAADIEFAIEYISGVVKDLRTLAS